MGGREGMGGGWVGGRRVVGVIHRVGGGGMVVDGKGGGLEGGVGGGGVQESGGERVGSEVCFWRGGVMVRRGVGGGRVVVVVAG